jgi:hypothetical protein
VSNEYGINGVGQNVASPRIGYAWQLPHAKRLVLRGGYGIYHSRSTGQPLAQEITSPPFGGIRALSVFANSAATDQTPFQPFPPVPSFPLITPTSNLQVRTLAPNFQPAALQVYSTNLQVQLANNYLLEVGYLGSRGTKIYETVAINQALSASTTSPVNGQTSNTLANISQRVPYGGFTPDGIFYVESGGSSWYNDLEVSVTKRYSHGLQFLASYTFARALSSNGGDVLDSAAGTAFAPGNQDSPRAGYGPAIFNREHRAVISYIYDLPSPKNWGTVANKFAGGWAVSGVTTIQSGNPLTITNTNAANAFGISEDRAQFAAGCTKSQLATPGATGTKLNNWFNTGCLTPTYPIIGADGVATAFGNTGVGIVTGPGQFNWDMSILKNTRVRWPNEVANVQFRAEFFNTFNHPQFAIPDTNYTDLGSTFGVITGTSVNPRFIQFALKFSF